MPMFGSDSIFRRTTQGPTALEQPWFRVTRGVDPGWLPAQGEEWPDDAAPTRNGKRAVAPLIAAQHWEGVRPLIVVTAEDLWSPGCASLFGYANRKANVAVVSTFQLQCGSENLLRERLAKVIAHEWMHLAGRGHCKAPGCLMHTVGCVEELDARGETLCKCCRHGRGFAMAALPRVRWRTAAIVAISLLLLLGGIDITVKALQTKSRPFSADEAGGRPAVFYKGEEILRFSGSREFSEWNQAPDEAQHVAAELNRLFTQIDPPPLAAIPIGTGALVTAGDRRLFHASLEMAGNTRPIDFARHWAARWEPILQGKGSPRESCPDCHIRRRAQIRETVARPPRIWR